MTGTTTSPHLTLAIPTFNRAAFVAIAIDSLCAQNNVSDRWNVVVVNNNSTDDTARSLAELARTWPRLIALEEPTPGASRARNRALAWAHSRDPAGYILYADDECKFPPDYIDRALAIIDTHAPKLFGGPIHPWYPEPPPAWFRPEYGSYSLPWATGLSNRISLSAGNMGFANAALKAIGGFDPAKGPRGKQLAYGEETALENRILETYGPDAIWFAPDLINFHAVLREKFRLGHMLRENFLRGYARGELQAAGLVPDPNAPVPPSLRPHPKPAELATAAKPSLHNHALRIILGLVRRAGLAWHTLTAPNA